MYLASIDLFGFKSFAQRTKINFQPGITAIVGPNGCGKSNLVDAVRWVLGEQRESLLRSDRMENVIFAGSRKRRPLGMAEISLTLHDSDGTLPLEYGEVTVTRRLFRSGKSEYLLNKTVCRLKDMVDLFMDTGVGPDSYSIIELKMVEDIISEDPIELRRLFDEATGITRYKARRKEALRRLEDARQDRERVLDILGEVEKQANSLKRQVAKVRAYKRLQEKIAKVKAVLVLAKVRSLEAQLDPLNRSLTDLQGQYQRLTGELGAAEAEAVQIENNLLTLENEGEKITAEYRSLQAEFQAAMKEKNRFEEALRLNTWRRNANKEEAAKTTDLLRQLDDELQKARENSAHLKENLPALEERLQDQQQTFAAADLEFKTARAASLECRNKLDTLRSQATANIRFAEERKAQLKSLSARLEEVSSRKEQQEENLAQAQRTLEEVQTDLQNRSRTIAELRSRRAQTETRIASIIEEIRSLQQELEQKRAEQDRISLQIDHYRELHRRSSPLFEGGRVLAETYPASVSGTLADELVVDPRYIPAVETALRSMAYSRTLESSLSIETIQQLLETSQAGPAAVLMGDPPDFKLDTARRFAAQKHGKVLAETIENDTKTASWIRYYLRNSVLFDAFEDLLKAAPDAAREEVILVSSDGAFTDGAGLWIIGARTDSEPQVIGVSARLEELAQQLHETIESAEKLQPRLAELRAELDTLRSDSSADAETLKREQQQFERQSGVRIKLEAKIENLQLQLQQLARESADLPGKIAALESYEHSSADQIDIFEKQQALLEEELQRQQEQETIAWEEREALRQSLADIQIEVERAHAEVQRAADHFAVLEQRHLQLDDHGKALSAESQNLLEEDRKLHHDLETASRKVDEFNVSIEALKTRLDDLESRRRADQEQQRSQNAQMRDLRTRLEEISEKTHHLQLQKVELETALKEEIPKLDGMDLGALDQETADEDTLARFERKLLAMEPLNLAAEQEYAEQKKRLDFLQEQLRDLDDAEKSLQQTIATLNREAKEKFDVGFERIRANFKEVFHEIFNGGDADFRLVQDDSLESRIEILASPGSKKIGSLSLLSGGEKALTAIALLFSIYIEKPSPFCILDEVDAPLDDENTIRFNRLLEKFTPKTQFLVVTHNKSTMEAAQTLLGVTMEEDGISKVVPVQLN